MLITQEGIPVDNYVSCTLVLSAVDGYPAKLCSFHVNTDPRGETYCCTFVLLTKVFVFVFYLHFSPTSSLFLAQHAM